MNLDSIKSLAVASWGRGSLILQKRSPEIFLALGILGGVGTVALVIAETRKLDDILKEADELRAKITEVKESIGESKEGNQEESEQKYTQEDFDKAIAVTYFRQAAKIGKLYLPAITLGLTSTAFILASYKIMSGRNAALVAAYNVVDLGFSQYRQRVVDELGKDKDRFFRFGKEVADYVEEKPKDEVPWKEDGEEKKEKEARYDICPNLITDSIYARWFDASSVQWRKDRSLNIYFLMAQQKWANDRLDTYGHVFLNEVYDSLGLPRSREGAVVGWIKDIHNKGIREDGDGKISFGLFDPVNEPNHDYVNGYNQKAILLDFNVDGTIWDKI